MLITKWASKTHQEVILITLGGQRTQKEKWVPRIKIVTSEWANFSVQSALVSTFQCAKCSGEHISACGAASVPVLRLCQRILALNLLMASKYVRIVLTSRPCSPHGAPHCMLKCAQWSTPHAEMCSPEHLAHWNVLTGALGMLKCAHWSTPMVFVILLLLLLLLCCYYYSSLTPTGCLAFPPACKIQSSVVWGDGGDDDGWCWWCKGEGHDGGGDGDGDDDVTLTPLVDHFFWILYLVFLMLF